MGPAPANATPKNYFLPLVVVYARWCSALARSASVRPTVTQITWAKNGDGQPWHFFLGSSSAGFNKSPAAYKLLVGATRHSYLHRILQAPWTAFGRSPARDAHNNAGTNFGNCAETYPFLYILGCVGISLSNLPYGSRNLLHRDQTLKNNSFGIAFHVASATHAAYNGENYWRRGPMMPPCDPNCQQLMSWYGVSSRLQHFELWTT